MLELTAANAAASVPDAASVLSALAAMAKNAPPAAPPVTQPSTSYGGGSIGNSGNPADPRGRNAISPPQQLVTPVSIPSAQPNPPTSAATLAALTALLPQAVPYNPHFFTIFPNLSQPAASAIDPQKLALIQLLLQQGVPIDQITTILNGQQSQQPQTSAAPQSYPLSPRARRRESRSMSRSPPPRRRSPSRSISPPPRGRGRGRRRDSFDSPPPRRRRSPSYDDYRRRSPSRSRSPPGRRRGSPPLRERSPLRRNSNNIPPVIDEKDYKPRFIEHDDTLKPDRIRGIPMTIFEDILMTVLSRTLFVGGITNRITEDKLRGLFSKFGSVQSIIMNPEKRCAFLKMYTREGAVKAREGMESYPTDDTTIRVHIQWHRREADIQTKYGVGFGPRDCSDYATGVSIIPISRLTDADRKWVVTADYGGTGGRPLEAGMTIEEPDIEIGQGVSSKAISQKIHLRGNPEGTSRGGGGTGRGRGRGREDRAWNQQRDEGFQGVNAGEGVPVGFPPFQMMQGQPGMFPPGQFPPFMMPPQMQAFFQQQFGGGQGSQGSQSQDGGVYFEQQGNEGQ